MTRRRLAVAAVGAVTVLAAGFTVLGSSGGEGPAAGAEAPTGRATVVRTDVVSRREVRGALGFADVDGGLSARVAGAVTAIAEEGAVIEPGSPLFDLGGEPVLLLTGEEPLHRDLVQGLRGPDVAVLNTTLGIEGDEFTSATAEALRAAQAEAGGTPTGVLRPSHAVVLPGAVRMGAHEVVPGTEVPAATKVAVLALDELVVTVDLDARERDRVVVGQEVEVVLPSGDTIPGAVRSVASVATQETEEDDPTVEVVIALDDAAAADGLTGASVDVSVTNDRADDVLAVPVTALVALAEGGYGVEVVRDGKPRLIGVETGMFSDTDDLVEVRGELAEGDEVVVPA